MNTEERRTSRIPRPSRPSSTGTPLQEKVGYMLSAYHPLLSGQPCIFDRPNFSSTRAALQSPNVQFGLNTERRLTTTDRKRKAAAGLDVVPEYGNATTSAHKRPAYQRPGSAQPARSAPATNRSAPSGASSGGEECQNRSFRVVGVIGLTSP